MEGAVDMGQFVCDGTCAGNELGDCNHGASNDGLQRTSEKTTRPDGWPGDDDEVRAIFVRLIGYVAKSKASHGDKNDALQCITAWALKQHGQFTRDSLERAEALLDSKNAK
jgi:hypothetical protein